MRVTVDTNIVVFAFLWGGDPRRVIDSAVSRSIVIYTSEALIAELFDVLSRKQFVKQLTAIGSSVGKIVDEYTALSKTIDASPSSLLRARPWYAISSISKLTATGITVFDSDRVLSRSASQNRER